jgi:hypothetical protein
VLCAAAGFHARRRLTTTARQSLPKTPIPNPIHREAARVFAERRDFSVVDVIEATEKFAQPHLLETMTGNVATGYFQSAAKPSTTTIVGPFPRIGS